MKLYKKKKIIQQQKKRKKTPNRGNTFPVATISGDRGNAFPMRWLQFPSS
jgi:hypothetical protein